MYSRPQKARAALLIECNDLARQSSKVLTIQTSLKVSKASTLLQCLAQGIRSGSRHFAIFYIEEPQKGKLQSSFSVKSLVVFWMTESSNWPRKAQICKAEMLKIGGSWSFSRLCALFSAELAKGSGPCQRSWIALLGYFQIVLPQSASHAQLC